jgi:hypothetical protein
MWPSTINIVRQPFRHGFWNTTWYSRNSMYASKTRSVWFTSTYTVLSHMFCHKTHALRFLWQDMFWGNCMCLDILWRVFLCRYLFSILSACSGHSVIKHATRFFATCKCLRNPIMSKIPTLVCIKWSRVLSENHKYPQSRVTRFVRSHDIYDRTLVRKKNAVHSFWCFEPSLINTCHVSWHTHGDKSRVTDVLVQDIVFWSLSKPLFCSCRVFGVSTKCFPASSYHCLCACLHSCPCRGRRTLAFVTPRDRHCCC